MRTRLTILAALVLLFAAVTLLFMKGYLGGRDAMSAGDEPLETSEFVAAYVQLAMLAETMPIGTPEYDQERIRVLSEIGIKPEQVERTLAYYNERPDLWRPIWEQIQADLVGRLDDSKTAPMPADTVRIE
jgi:hypothetical protein